MKLFAYAGWPLAAVLAAFWKSAEEDRKSLELSLRHQTRARAECIEKLLDSEEQVRRAKKRICEATGATEFALSRLGQMSELCGVSVIESLDAAQWAELREHARALLDGTEYGPPPHVETRGEPPPGWQELLAAVDRFDRWARGLIDQPPTRRDGSGRPPPASPDEQRRCPQRFPSGSRAGEQCLLPESHLGMCESSWTEVSPGTQSRMVWKASAVPPSPAAASVLAPIGWTELTAKQRAEVQLHIDDLVHAPAVEVAFRVVSTGEAMNHLKTIRVWATGVDDELAILQQVVAHRDRLATQVAELQAVGSEAHHIRCGMLARCGGKSIDEHWLTDQVVASFWRQGWLRADRALGGATSAPAEWAPGPLGDTPEEIAGADAEILGYFGRHNPEWWGAQQVADFDTERLDGDAEGRHARAIGRYLQKAANSCFARAAELDQQQGKGSWARQTTEQKPTGKDLFVSMSKEEFERAPRLSVEEIQRALDEERPKDGAA